jgi:hypothetical protein
MENTQQTNNRKKQPKSMVTKVFQRLRKNQRGGIVEYIVGIALVMALGIPLLMHIFGGVKINAHYAYNLITRGVEYARQQREIEINQHREIETDPHYSEPSGERNR